MSMLVPMYIVLGEGSSGDTLGLGSREGDLAAAAEDEAIAPCDEEVSMACLSRNAKYVSSSADGIT